MEVARKLEAGSRPEQAATGGLRLGRRRCRLAGFCQLLLLATQLLPLIQQQVAAWRPLEPILPRLMMANEPPSPQVGFMLPPASLVAPQQVFAGPGSGPQPRQAERFEPLVWPHDEFASSTNNLSLADIQRTSYVIDRKRFVEAVPTRCFASTLLEDPEAVEPSFVIIRPRSEIRLNATAPLEAIQAAGFEASKPTVILVHGFTQSYPSTDWLRKTRSLFELNVALERQNLVFMDWGVASHGSYSQVAAMVSGMGSFLANFLMKLIDLGANRLSFHIIGHSLGAHLAGFAGKRIRPRIGRITALDPAGPCFGKLFSNSPNDRLGPNDAYEVDVYHYDDDFLGLAGQVGQFDVYVNGGSSQPGAKDNVNTMLEALVTMLFRRNRVLSESHTRSTEVSTAQLSLSGCQQVAFECRDWPAFLSGECGRCDESNSQCFFMGFNYQYQHSSDLFPSSHYPTGPAGPQDLRTSHPGRRFYIATKAQDYFCLQHHQLLVKFEPQPELAQAAKRNRWRLFVELVNERDERRNVTISNQLTQNIFSHLLLSESRPLRFTAAVLQVRAADNSPVLLRPSLAGPASKGPPRPGSAPSHFQLSSIEINFMSNVSPRARRALSSRLCPSGWLGPAENAVADSLPADDWLALVECEPR